MKAHELDTAAVETAIEEVVMRDFVIASAEGRAGGWKKLYYNPGTKVFTIQTTGQRPIEVQTADMAAVCYSER